MSMIFFTIESSNDFTIVHRTPYKEKQHQTYFESGDFLIITTKADVTFQDNATEFIQEANEMVSGYDTAMENAIEELLSSNCATHWFGNSQVLVVFKGQMYFYYGNEHRKIVNDENPISPAIICLSQESIEIERIKKVYNQFRTVRKLHHRSAIYQLSAMLDPEENTDLMIHRWYGKDKWKMDTTRFYKQSRS